MSTPRTARYLTALRECGPYVLIELLLPGGTLFALLLWLSRRFVRKGLYTVRQHAIRQPLRTSAISAKADPGLVNICICRGHAVVLGASRTAFTVTCANSATTQACCA